VLGTDSRADDIARAGFALVFFEEGGFSECCVEKIKPRRGTKIIKMPEL
jgi:hypothetical protein